MLSYFGIYSQFGKSLFDDRGDRNRRRFSFNVLPHEIAALNASASSARKTRRSTHFESPKKLRTI